MSTSIAAPSPPSLPKNLSQLRASLKKWFQKTPADQRRITLIFGAGVSIAMAQPKYESLAKWQGLLEGLIKGVDKDFKNILDNKDPAERWLRRSALQHRQHMIRTLSLGDSDMAVATTYLLDRIYKQHEKRDSASGQILNPYRWQGGLNTLMEKVETDVEKHATWAPLIRDLGVRARKGQVLMVTTNFDHMLAKLARLPVYLCPQNRPGTQSGAASYDPWPDGFVIPFSEVAGKRVMSPQRATQVLKNVLPSPAAFRRAWTSPASLHRNWFDDLASVLHIHGSRRLPPSLVFDPSSYDAISPGGGEITNVLNLLLNDPAQSGAIFFIGCGGTLFDPHFVNYWHLSGTKEERFIACLAQKKEADDLCRQFHIPKYDSKPHIGAYADHGDLPGELAQIISLLP